MPGAVLGFPRAWAVKTEAVQLRRRWSHASTTILTRLWLAVTLFTLFQARPFSMAACGIQAQSSCLGLDQGPMLLSFSTVSATPILDQECFDASDLDDLAAPEFRRLVESDMLVIYCSKEMLPVCLSAVVANPDELAGWIGEVHDPAEFRALSRRSILLVWHFCTCCGLHLLLIEQGDRMNWRLKLRRTQRGVNSDSLWNESEYDSPTRKQRKVWQCFRIKESYSASPVVPMRVPWILESRQGVT